MVSKKSTKNRIMLAAISLFEKKGYDNVTFSNIATKVQVSQPAIYNHFSSKAEILAACAEYSVGVLHKEISQHIKLSDPLAVIMKSYIYNNLKWFVEQRDLGNVICATYYFSNVYAEISEIRSKLEKLDIQNLEQLLMLAARHGEIKAHDYSTTARIIHSLVVGEIFKIYFDPDIINIQKRTSDILIAAQSILFSNSYPLNSNE